MPGGLQFQPRLLWLTLITCQSNLLLQCEFATTTKMKFQTGTKRMFLIYILWASSSYTLGNLCKEFQCLQNKTECIPYDKFCDGTPHCSDGSDEFRYQNKPTSTPIVGIPCRQFYYTCILPHHMISKSGNICGRDLVCQKEEFKCTDESGCLPSSWFCGGINDCVDGSDENQFISEAGQYEILHSGCLLDVGIICDGNINFKNGIDECLCPMNPRRYSDDKCFRCLTHSQTVLTVGKLCDGTIDCPDASDECMCGKDMNIQICKDISGEWQSGLTSFQQHLTCVDANSQLLTHSLDVICDGKIDCANEIDETNCSKDCGGIVGRQANRNCGQYNCSIFGKQATACNGIPTCASDMYGEECSPECTEKPRLCNYVEEMPEKKGWTRVKCDVKNTSFEYLDGVQLCDGKIDCADGEDEIDCPHRFYCKTGTPYSVSIDKVCDQERDCDDGSDEPTSCSLECSDDGSVEFVSLSQICDGTKNCKKGLDECQPGCVNTAFSDNNSLIRNKGILVLVSIISFMALAGNISVISQMTYRFITSQIRNESEKIAKLFVFSLSFADLLVGIFTSAICLKAASESRRYCLHDREWRSSSTCSALGVLIVVGSQQSVFTMVLITVFRVHAVSNLQSKSHSNRYMVALIVSWIISLLLGVIPEFPSLEDYFVDAFSYDGNKLFATIKTEDKEMLSKWLLTMENDTQNLIRNYGYLGSWSLLRQLITKVNPSYISHRKFGFYSSHSVCLPTLFPSRERDTAWVYSLFLIIINFVAFFCIFTGGVVIYKKTAPKISSDKAEINNRTGNLKRNLTRIVVTDFFCWIPICIMAFLQVSGVDIPGDAYIPVGLLIIPINSALNPFLYSNIPEIIWEKTRPARDYVTKQAARFKAGAVLPGDNSSSGEQVGGQITLATVRSADEELAIGSNDRPSFDGRIVKSKSRVA